MIKLKSLIESLFYESDKGRGYYDSMSDDEHDVLSNDYFSVGQSSDEAMRKSYCWIWQKSTQSIDARMGGTHSSNFGYTVKDYTYSGWYDPETNNISFVFPDSELRKLGTRRPTEEDIPETVYRKLINKFGKRKPKFLVFELYSDATSYPYFWMDPQDNFHRLSGMNHSEWAIRHLNRPGINKQNVHKVMFKLGWIRIGMGDFNDQSMIEYHYSGIKPGRNRVKKIEDLGIEHGAKWIRDDVTGTFTRL